jgi:O-antigen/teichoic acid export membrane protein
MLKEWFPAGSLRRIIAGNTLSQLVGRVVSSITIVIVSVIIAQRFGPEGYGDFVKITTYVGFFYLLADFGLNAVYLQQTASPHASATQIASEPWRILLGLRLVISLSLVFAALAILSLFPHTVAYGYTPLVRFGIALLVPVIVAQAITTTTNALFQKMLRYDYSTKAQNIGSFFLVAVALLLSQVTAIGGPMLGVASVFAGSTVTAIVALVLVHRHLGSVSPLFSQKRFFAILTHGAPLGFALVFNLIYFHSDSVILALNRSTQEVGIYGLAYKVFELPLVLPIFFMNAVYPLLLERQRMKNNGQQKIFERSLQFLLASSLLITTGLWIAAPLVSLVRPDFSPSVLPLRVLSMGLPVFFVSALFMWFIIAQKKQRSLVVIHGIGMVGNILFNLWLVPSYGYMAAAWVTIGSEVFVLIATAALVLPHIYGPAKKSK